jgi:hypothetical protein
MARLKNYKQPVGGALAATDCGCVALAAKADRRPAPPTTAWNTL